MRKCGGDHLCTSVVLLALGVTFTVTLGILVLASDPALVKVGDLSPRYSRKTKMTSLENNPIVLSSLVSFTLISHEQCPNPGMYLGSPSWPRTASSTSSELSSAIPQMACSLTLQTSTKPKPIYSLHLLTDSTVTGS